MDKKTIIAALLALALNYRNETSDTISQKRNIPLAGEGERDGVWGWIEQRIRKKSELTPVFSGAAIMQG